MRGTVLGYGDNKGVIVTEDDRRFSFNDGNWRDQQPPVRGAVVDFVDRGDTADEIYLALGTRPPRPAADGSPGASANEALRRFGGWIKAFPQVAVAAFILLVSLLISYASVGSTTGGMNDFGLGLREQPALISLNGALAPLRDSIGIAGDELENRLDNLRTVTGPPSEFTTRQVREAERMQGALGRLNWTLVAAYLFFLVPLLAIALIVFYLVGKRRLAVISSIALGVLSIFSGFYMWLLEGAVMNLVPDEGRVAMRRALSRAFSLEAGGWLIALSGVALIVLLFIPRRTEAVV
jgi:hypothetical protein